MVALHGAGDFFGEGCLTGQPLRLATVSAMTDCVIMRIDKTDMVRTLRDEPKLSEVFMAYILARNAAFGQLGAVGGDPSSLVLGHEDSPIEPPRRRCLRQHSSGRLGRCTDNRRQARGVFWRPALLRQAA